METHKVPSVSHSVTLDIYASEQQGFSAHSTGTFKTVTSIGHATEPTVFGTAATTGGFQSGIGYIVVNEVFHLCHPFLFASCVDPAWHGFVQSLASARLAEDDVRADVPVQIDGAICGTSS